MTNYTYFFIKVNFRKILKNIFIIFNISDSDIGHVLSSYSSNYQKNITS